MLAEILQDTLTDGIKLLPFLFFTYLIMEYIEHKTSHRTRHMMQRSGRFGPILGGLFGVVPQCGFSAAASNLYAGRVITLGTLLAVFLSTSDEMLPVFLSRQVPFSRIFNILAFKVAIGIVVGLTTDILMKKWKKTKGEELRIGQVCQHQHCQCWEKKIWRSALSHTLEIFLFILGITFFLNLLIGFAGEENLSGFIRGRAVLGPLFAGLVGLIPNCASSVILAELYLEGILGAGSMLAGLLAGSGVGLLVLYRVNDGLWENLKITMILYVAGVVSGILTELSGFVF